MCDNWKLERRREAALEIYSGIQEIDADDEWSGETSHYGYVVIAVSRIDKIYVVFLGFYFSRFA